MLAWITEYVQGCATCHKTKSSRHPPAPSFTSPPLPSCPSFQQIANGSHHRPSRVQPSRFLLNMGRSRLLSCSGLPPMFQGNLGTQIAPALLRHMSTDGSAPRKDHLRPETPVTSHFGRALARESLAFPESVNSLSPSDRWPIPNERTTGSSNTSVY